MTASIFQRGTTLKKLTAAVEAVGGTVEENDAGRNYKIEALAPDGQRWVEGSTHVMVAYGGDGATKAEAWGELLARVGYGLETCDCEDCNG